MDPFRIYTNINSLCCIPETNVMAYVNCTVIFKRQTWQSKNNKEEKIFDQNTCCKLLLTKEIEKTNQYDYKTYIYLVQNALYASQITDVPQRRREFCSCFMIYGSFVM